MKMNNAKRMEIVANLVGGKSNRKSKPKKQQRSPPPKNLTRSPSSNESSCLGLTEEAPMVSGFPTGRRRSSIHNASTGSTTTLILGAPAGWSKSCRRNSVGSTTVSSARSFSEDPGSPMMDSRMMDSRMPIALPSKKILIVQSSWSVIQHLPNYQDAVAEAVLVHMVQSDASVRQRLALPSFRSERFEEMTVILTSVLDDIVGILAPDLEVHDLRSYSQQWRDEGLRAAEVNKALVPALQSLVELSSYQVDAWNDIFGLVTEEM